MRILLKSFLALFCFIFVAAGCARQHSAESAESSQMITLHNGNLVLPDKQDAPKLIYVDARQSASHAPHLAQHLGQTLKKSKFRLADTPSKAGYILHVNILRDGQVSPQNLQSAVNAGYGGKAAFSGDGAKAMLVDALMVQRRVPKAPRPSRQRMKNISSRNALGSAQMRLAVISSNKNAPTRDAFSRAIASELATRLEKAD